MKKKILGMGNAVLDIIFSCQEKDLVEMGLIKGQMSLVENDNSENIFKKFNSVKKSSGGSVANTITGISLLGGNSSFCGRVCDDNIGNFFISDINDSGVNFLCSPKNGIPTAKCLVFVTDDGERTMQTFLGASINLDENDIYEDFFSDVSILLIEGYLWSSLSARKAISKAVRIAKSKNIIVAFSLSDSGLVEMYKKEFYEFIKNHVDILIGNFSEFKSLIDEQDFNEINKKLFRIAEKAVMTRGYEGATLFINNNYINCDAVKNEAIIDTTGAGDMFAAGFLHFINIGKSYSEAMQYGCEVASKILSQYGGRPEKENFQK